jgi:hypothetical protein
MPACMHLDRAGKGCLLSMVASGLDSPDIQLERRVGPGLLVVGVCAHGNAGRAGRPVCNAGAVVGVLLERRALWRAAFHRSRRKFGPDFDWDCDHCVLCVATKTFRTPVARSPVSLTIRRRGKVADFRFQFFRASVGLDGGTEISLAIHLCISRPGESRIGVRLHELPQQQTRALDDRRYEPC